MEEDIGGFWSSPAGRAVRRNDRRQRVRYLHITGEPEGKGGRGNRAVLPFQRQALEQLGQLRSGVLTGPLVLDLRFTAARKSPPAIHRVAKWALDVLGPAAPALVSGGRRHVLYRDDRQVKLLSVRMNQNWNPGAPLGVGHTYVTAWPLRDVLAELEDATWRRDHVADCDCVGRCAYFADAEAAEECVRDEDSDLGFGWSGEGPSEVLQSWLRFHQRERAQRQLLKSTDRAVGVALRSGLRMITGARPLHAMHTAARDLESDMWRMVMSEPITVRMPGLPEGPGQRGTYLRAAREQLQAFQCRWPVLQPLLTPLKLTILVVPPRQGKDLDNIALDILPIAHDVLRPHIDPWLETPALSEDSDREARIRRLRSLNAMTVTSYQVIELQRSPDDRDGAMLRLALGLGDQYDSPWAH